MSSAFVRITVPCEPTFRLAGEDWKGVAVLEERRVCP